MLKGHREPDPVAGGSALLFWSKIAGNAGFFVAVLILARALGPTGRGTIAFITVTALVAARLAGLGITEATTVFVARRVEVRGALLTNAVVFLFGSALLTAAVACGALIALGDQGPAGIGAPELAVIVAATVVSAMGDAGYCVLLGCGRLRPLALITATASWVYPVFLLAIWSTAGLTVLGAAVAWTVAESIRAGAYLAPSLMTTAPRRSSTTPRRSRSRRTRFVVALRGSRELGQLLLREGDLAAVELAQLGDPVHDALVGRQVIGLRQLVGQPPHPLAEQPGKQAVDARMFAPEPFEVPDEHRARLRRLERGDRRRPLGTFPGKQRELTERVARPPHAEQCRCTERRRDPDREPAADDQMEAVRGIAAVEHDLAAVEGPPACDRKQAPHVFLRHPVEQLPLHRCVTSLTLGASRA